MGNERYINVEKAISILRLRSQQLAGMYGDLGGAASGAALILERLADEEAEDVAPVVKGEWTYDSPYDVPHCNNCGQVSIESIFGRSEPNFCPNCGAAMNEEALRIIAERNKWGDAEGEDDEEI